MKYFLLSFYVPLLHCTFLPSIHYTSLLYIWVVSVSDSRSSWVPSPLLHMLPLYSYLSKCICHLLFSIFLSLTILIHIFPSAVFWIAALSPLHQQVPSSCLMSASSRSCWTVRGIPTCICRWTIYIQCSQLIYDLTGINFRRQYSIDWTFYTLFVLYNSELCHGKLLSYVAPVISPSCSSLHFHFNELFKVVSLFYSGYIGTVLYPSRQRTCPSVVSLMHNITCPCLFISI